MRVHEKVVVAEVLAAPALSWHAVCAALLGTLTRYACRTTVLGATWFEVSALVKD